jgi:hypothetical protein
MRWIVLLNVLLLISCKRDCNEYIKEVESKENKLLLEKEMNGIVYSMQYQPIDYILYKEFRTCDLNTAEIEKRRKELGDMDYFELKIKAKDNSDVLMKYLDNENKYYERLNYCSFDMQDDFNVIDGKDTIISSLYHFQNNYGLHSHISFMIAFGTNRDASGKKQILYKDYAFGNGMIQFDFETEALQKLMNNN